jgi:hypothetical protein
MVQANSVANRSTEKSPCQRYVYRWDRQGRKGHACFVTARGKMNSCRVEFEDGFKMITSRNALRRFVDREVEAKTTGEE